MERRFYIQKLSGWTELRSRAETFLTTFYVYDTLNACRNVAEFSVRGTDKRRIAGTLLAAQAEQRRLERAHG